MHGRALILKLLSLGLCKSLSTQNRHGLGANRNLIRREFQFTDSYAYYIDPKFHIFRSLLNQGSDQFVLFCIGEIFSVQPPLVSEKISIQD